MNLAELNKVCFEMERDRQKSKETSMGIKIRIKEVVPVNIDHDDPKYCTE